MHNQAIEDSEGYRKLKAAVYADENSGWSLSARLETLTFAVERARHYEEHTGIPAGEILTDWENRRSFWYMNYYQDANQPKIGTKRVRVFATTLAMMEATGQSFRCPYCNGIGGNPYRCEAGTFVENLKGEKGPCDWSVEGLFGELGKGVYVFVKDKMAGEWIFMPLAWELEFSTPDCAVPE